MAKAKKKSKTSRLLKKSKKRKSLKSSKRKKVKKSGKPKARLKTRKKAQRLKTKGAPETKALGIDEEIDDIFGDDDQLEMDLEDLPDDESIDFL